MRLCITGRMISAPWPPSFSTIACCATIIHRPDGDGRWSGLFNLRSKDNSRCALGPTRLKEPEPTIQICPVFTTVVFSKANPLLMTLKVIATIYPDTLWQCGLDKPVPERRQLVHVVFEPDIAQ